MTAHPESSQPRARDERRSDVRSTWAVSSLTMISRILGFFRLVLLVQLFSNLRWASDAFIFAFRIPNLFRNLLGEGALSAAFIPAFVKTESTEGKYSAGILGSQAFTLLSIIGGAIAALGMLACLVLDRFSDSEELSLATHLTMLLFPFMPLICLSALLGGMLQSIRRFSLPAAMPIILNIGFLSAFAYIYWWQCGGDLGALEAWSSTRVIAVVILVAGLVEVLVQLPALAANGILVRPIPAFDHPALKTAIKAFVPVALGLGLVQINAFTDSLIAGWLSLRSSGAVTYLEVAFRYVQLPLGVFGVAIATVSFPAFASSVVSGNRDLLCQRLVRAVRMSLFLILPSAAVLAAMADPIVRLTCQRPDLTFNHAAVYRASLALILYSAGLAFFSIRQILVRAFYALGEYTLPVKISSIMVVLNLLLNLTLIHAPDLYRIHFPGYYQHWNLSDASFPLGTSLGEAGLALATSLTAVVDTLVLGLALRRRLLQGTTPDIRSGEWNKLWTTALRMLAASVALGVLVWFYRDSIPYEPGLMALLQRTVIPCLLGGATFYIIGIVLPLPEMGEFLFAMLGRKKKAAKESGE